MFLIAEDDTRLTLPELTPLLPMRPRIIISPSSADVTQQLQQQVSPPLISVPQTHSTPESQSSLQVPLSLQPPTPPPSSPTLLEPSETHPPPAPPAQSSSPKHFKQQQLLPPKLPPPSPVHSEATPSTPNPTMQPSSPSQTGRYLIRDN